MFFSSHFSLSARLVNVKYCGPEMPLDAALQSMLLRRVKIEAYLHFGNLKVAKEVVFVS